MAASLLTLAHLICCILILIFAFLSIASISVVRRNFHGHCLIGANLTFHVQRGKVYEVLAEDKPAGNSNCVFPLFMGYVALFFSIAYLVWNGCLIFNSRESSWRDSFIGTSISAIITLSLLIAGAMISEGINKLCDALRHGGHACDWRNYDISDWLAWKEDDGNVLDPDTMITTSYYTLFKIGQVGCWLSFTTFVAILIIYLMKLKRNSVDGGFIENFTQERNRLVDGTNQRRYDQI